MGMDDALLAASYVKAAVTIPVHYGTWPIIEYDDIDKVINIIKEIEKPLACYIFSQRKENAENIINSLSYFFNYINNFIYIIILNNR